MLLQGGVAMTKHDMKLQTPAASIQNLPHVEPSSWRVYVPLGLLFVCLLLFDTETRTQHALLGLLMLVAALLLWLGSRLRVPAQGSAPSEKSGDP
jgi:hypothetical protein